MKIERFKISHGSVVEIGCCCVLSFTNNVLTLKVETEEVVLYINTDTGSKIKNSFNIIEVDEASKIDNLDKKSEAEGKLILEKCSGVIVSLDSRGKMLESPEIAEFIKSNQFSVVSEISFVIGGSNGLSIDVIKSSKFVFWKNHLSTSAISCGSCRTNLSCLCNNRRASISQIKESLCSINLSS